MLTRQLPVVKPADGTPSASVETDSVDEGAPPGGLPFGVDLTSGRQEHFLLPLSTQTYLCPISGPRIAARDLDSHPSHPQPNWTFQTVGAFDHPYNHSRWETEGR